MAPFYGWGSSALRLQSHYEEAVYFLPLSSQKFLVLIWSTSEPPSGFEYGTPKSSTLTTRPLFLIRPYAKCNLKIYYLPPYKRTVLHCRKANTDLIRKAISLFNWERSFRHNDIGSKVYLFNKTIKNILGNYILHEFGICDDRDPP